MVIQLSYCICRIYFNNVWSLLKPGQGIRNRLEGRQTLIVWLCSNHIFADCFPRQFDLWGE